MQPPRLFPYAFLLLLLSFDFISVISTQDIRYYQDLLPDLSPKELALKLQVERMLKSPRPYQHLDDFDGNVLQRRREFERQALQDVLSLKSNNIHGLPKRRQKHIPNYPPSQVQADGLGEDPILREYTGINPREFHPHFYPYPSPDIADPILNEAKNQRLQDSEYPTVGYRPAAHHQFIDDKGMKEETQSDFFGKQHHSRHDQLTQQQRFTGGTVVNDRNKIDEKFTYSYDGMDKWKQDTKSPFALRPDQEGYYDSEVPILTKSDVIVPQEDERTAAVKFGKDEEQEEQEDGEEEREGEDTETTIKNIEMKIKNFRESITDAQNTALLGFDRADRADNYSPSVLAVDHKINNDIYFVAVVAGCSAAAMFILVLISLTWCRLQRGAKAAADVEYPAYGVTGPNKDTSPSGDRRLAQSAQMYHYQHQKQQIIAMESRTATGRDPGSVSEAESDEENEEGDYTVYECPGLAPTGEMEVKNPLFHDDPTPATPATTGQGQLGQNNKRSSEDHM